MGDDDQQVQQAQKLLEEAKERLENKKRDKLKADPQLLAGVAKKLAEDMANKKAKIAEVPTEGDQGGESAMEASAAGSSS